MDSIDNTMGYLARLKIRRAKIQRQREAMPKPLSLPERIETWFNSLSPEDKTRAWKMNEFKILFGESAQKIGASLFELGWSRKGKWLDSAPCARLWFKE